MAAALSLLAHLVVCGSINTQETSSQHCPTSCPGTILLEPSIPVHTLLCTDSPSIAFILVGQAGRKGVKKADCRCPTSALGGLPRCGPTPSQHVVIEDAETKQGTKGLIRPSHPGPLMNIHPAPGCTSGFALHS